MSQPKVAVVLSGAAARGAFQAGALAHLMPALRAQGITPKIVLGTSAGSINTALWGSFAHLDPVAAGDAVMDVWRSMDRPDVMKHPALTLATGFAKLLPGAFIGKGPGLAGLMDASPLRATAAKRFDAGQLARNVRDGIIETVGVTATRVPASNTPIASGRTVMFVDSAHHEAHKVADVTRAVDAAPTQIRAEHVLASCAIPVAFPAVWVQGPSAYRGYYADGGIRLNAPLRPAVALGADKIIVIAANATEHTPSPNPARSRDAWPDIADAIAMTLHTVLADRMIDDLNDLRARNQWVAEGFMKYRHIEYMPVSPAPGELALLAESVLKSKRNQWWKVLADSDGYAMERVLRGLGDGIGQVEILSYLFFDDEYFAAQMRLGADAAKAALARGWLS